MRQIVLFLMSLCVSFALYAQSKVTGKVIDESGTGIPNVSVLIKNTKSGTVTKDDGTFSIQVSASGTALIFTAIGREDLELRITGAKNYTVPMVSLSKSIDEVLVIGYGSTIKKSNFVGSSAQVTSKQFETRPLSNALNALVGAAPGVQTTTASGAPGSAPSILIRGFGSYSLANQPLYVIDGAIYEANGFANISPDDIESINILKDASTTALYGSKGANGVVMVTTKKAQKGKQSLQFNIKYGNSTPAIETYETVTPQQYYELAWEAYRNSLHFGNLKVPLDTASLLASGLLPRFTSGANAGKQNYKNAGYQDIYQVVGNYNPFNVGNTEIVGSDGKLNPKASLLYGNDLNWIDQATRTGKRTEYSVQYAANTDKSDISASVGYVKDQGWGLRSQLQRFNGRINASVKPTKWFKSGINLAGTKINSDFSATSGIANSFSFSRNIAPIYPVHLYKQGTNELLLDIKKQPQFDLGNTDGYARPYNSGRHAIAEHLWDKNNLIRDVLSARAFGEIAFKPWLKFTLNIGYDVDDTDNEDYNNTIVGDGAPAGRYHLEWNKKSYYTFNQLINFNKTFGLHSIDAVLGHENYDYKYTEIFGLKSGQSFDELYVFSNFTTVSSLTSNIIQRRTEGYLSRVNYSYADRYLASVSIRRDGNSFFPKEFRWANFWSIGGAWKISSEPFFKADWINLLKIKSSYGVVGNSALTNSYPYQPGYDVGYNDDTRSGILFGALGSPKLTWETQRPFDVGVEFAMFKNRLSGTIEYFNRTTSGLIFNVPQPSQIGGTVSGGFTIAQNVGSMRNRGVEIQLVGNIIHNKSFDWNLTVNATHYKNKLTKMPVETPFIQALPFRREAGKSIYEFYMRNYYGVDVATGQPLFKGIKTFDSITVKLIANTTGGFDTLTTDFNNAKLDYVGKNAIPDWYGSIRNDFFYKNFDLSFVLTYQLGGYIYDGVYASLVTSTVGGSNYHKDLLNSWSPAKTASGIPRLDKDKSREFNATNSRFLNSATSLSINNISLGYRIPRSLLSKWDIAGARVFVSGENLKFFSKRIGLYSTGSFSDSVSGGESTYGQVSNNYSVARIINFGVSVNF